MGTEVHYKSHLSGYYPMKDLKTDASNTWSFCYEDRTLGGNFCSSFPLRPSNGYTAYDKEVLKQTMLRHEEIFRKQVYELHRLYRIQRELMDELKTKEEQNFLGQLHSSQSSPFSNKMPPRDREKSWQGHGFTSVTATCSMTTVSGIGDAEADLDILNGSKSKTGITSRENGGSQVVDGFMNTNIRNRKMLDLQVPADACIDSEDAEQVKEKSLVKSLFGTADLANIKCGFLPENDVKLTLSTAPNRCSRDKTQNSSSHLQNGVHYHNLADLNEPPEELCFKEVVDSCNFAVQATHSERPQWHQNSSMKSASDFPSSRKDLFQGRFDGGGPVFLNTSRGENGWDPPIFKNEIGKLSSQMNYVTSNHSKADVKQSPEYVIEPKISQDASLIIFSAKQNESEIWLKEKAAQSFEASDSSCVTNRLNTRYSGLTAPTMSCSPSAFVHNDNARNASSVFSSRISHPPLVAPAFPCFSESTTNVQSRSSSTSSQNFGNTACDKRHCNHGSISTPSIGGREHFHPNGFHHNFRSESSASSHVYLPSVDFDKPNLNNNDSSDYEKLEGHGLRKHLPGLHCIVEKTENGMNLDLAPSNGFPIESAHKQKKLNYGKEENLPRGLSWLRTKPLCSELLNISNGIPQKEFGTKQGCSPPLLNYCASTQDDDQKKETEGFSSLDVLPSISRSNGAIIQQNEASVTPSSKRIFGFPLPQKTEWSSPADNVKDMIEEKFLHGDSSRHNKILDSEKQRHVELDLEKGVYKCPSGFRDPVNLNTSATSMEQLKSSESSPEDEVQLSSPTSAQDIAMQFVPVIDLEVPITSLEEQMPSESSALHFNQLLSLVEPERQNEGIKATEIGDEALVRMAAETIQIISLDKHIDVGEVVKFPSQTALADVLNWFADVVTCNADGLETVLDTSIGKGDGYQLSSDIDGMDYFEYMTLKLKEIKVNEYCSLASKTEFQKEEETGVAHLLLTRPRRGQGRRRRQRRDFQKDILPGLATLSRNEVTEDLQIIGGLMRAAGQSWQAGGSRRNNGRNRSQSQTKGRGQLRGTAAASVSETPLDPQPRQPSNAEVKIDGGSMLGWGRTTRRCWRQRCSSGNILVTPSS